MNKIRWIIQNNLIAENDIKQLQTSCKGLDIEFEEVLVIPFSGEIPKFTIDDKINIYYGSTTLIDNVYKQFNHPIGVFYDEKAFSMENYFGIWKELMLSYGSKITTLKEFTKESHKSDELFFIRHQSKALLRLIRPSRPIRGLHYILLFLSYWSLDQLTIHQKIF